MALVDEVRFIQHTEVGTDDFTIGAASIVITNPDGTNPSPEPSVNIDNGDSLPEHVVNTLWSITLGGRHSMLWTIGVGSQLLKRRETYFAYYTDVYGIVRQVTQGDDDALSDTEIDMEFYSLQRELTARFPTLGPYYALVGEDREEFDEGIAILAALRLKGYKPSTSPSGEITGWKTETVSLTINPGNSLYRGRIYDNWYERALKALGRVTAIHTYYADRAATIRLFDVTGPTRRANRTGPDTLFRTVARLMSDTFVSSTAGVIVE